MDATDGLREVGRGVGIIRCLKGQHITVPPGMSRGFSSAKLTLHFLLFNSPAIVGIFSPFRIERMSS
jgi:hypothetical protein